MKFWLRSVKSARWDYRQGASSGGKELDLPKETKEAQGARLEMGQDEFEEVEPSFTPS